MGSSKKYIFLNGLASLMSRGTRVLDQLLLVPFFLSSWGAAYYGEWLTLTVIPSVLAFSDLGFGSAASNQFVLSYSGNDKERAATVYKTGLYVVSFAIVIGIVLSFVVTYGGYKTGTFAKTLIDPTDGVVAVSFMMASRLISFYNQLFAAMYRVVHKVSLSINILSVENVVKILLSIILLVYGGGIVSLSVMHFVVALVFNSMYFFIGRRLVPDLPPSSFNLDEAKTIVTKGFGFFLMPIWQSIYFQGSTFAVRVVLGAEAVAVFNTVRTVCRSINQIYGIVNQAVFPEIQVALGSGNLLKAQKLFVNSVRLVFGIAVIGVILFSLFGPQLYEWWTHGMLNVDNNIWMILMIGVIMNSLWDTSGCIFRSVNKPYICSLSGLCASVISVGAVYLLASMLGVTGAAIGYVVLDVIMACVIIPLACKEIKIKLISIVSFSKQNCL